jgi:hypothetical protein
MIFNGERRYQDLPFKYTDEMKCINHVILLGIKRAGNSFKLPYGMYLQNARDMLDKQRRTPICQESPATISRQ